MNITTSFAASTRPFPYHVVPNFLGNDWVERLLAYAVEHQSSFVASGLGYRANARLDPSVRISSTLRNFGALRAELESLFRAAMPQAVSELRLSPFELSTCEIELVAHGDGAFFKRHIDTITQADDPDIKNHRVLTGVYYFHSVPKCFSGGQLRMHALVPQEQGGGFIDIEPERDQLVLFPAWAPHEVLPVSCPSQAFEHARFAINCWYRRPRP
ncbi:2OG-Fe(II) oxygenase [Candidatus Methylobacter oryzae]|uniref:2OG-Fe(II) oxygenase n=1 Tax=Candidatus Methylobacter oryzae TaxID=2497749 RepID=A0ABY3CGH2_9GAMM|nr:2OG-Fe(II) oxygenase [Candidatus Methylobacter oryzae]TRX01762.1 2OG-Fe(II) oxygenase [Candidatus Methylobacter oryzae]